MSRERFNAAWAGKSLTTSINFGRNQENEIRVLLFMDCFSLKFRISKLEQKISPVQISSSPYPMGANEIIC